MFDENHKPYWARVDKHVDGRPIVESFVGGTCVFSATKNPEGWSLSRFVPGYVFATAKLNIQAMVEALRLIEEIDTGVSTQAFVQVALPSSEVAKRVVRDLSTITRESAYEAASASLRKQTCPQKAGGKGCTLHNLHCSWPKCEA